MSNPTGSIVTDVAEIIQKCDFRVAVSRCISTSSPWIITVGESCWRRHLVVESVSNEGRVDAQLALLTNEQSYRFGYDVDYRDVERRITLSDLVSQRYTSVIAALRP